VWLGQPSPWDSEAVVDVLNSGQRWPTLKINDEPVSWATLPTTLTQILANQREKLVLVRANGLLSFADLIHVIDLCRLTGSEVVLVTPGPQQSNISKSHPVT
jgi:biopolymer transport protein ExbD